ncbi:hypothetical protein ASG25_05635 [Rhizobium sp. Leaf384]|nr:hypothetical protein ASG25_05635 [Rhizobium sp. Leaf384]KQS86852.1 hypothetical protein ASG58_00935 [Rhizobium sp. Leaf383]
MGDMLENARGQAPDGGSTLEEVVSREWLIDQGKCGRLVLAPEAAVEDMATHMMRTLLTTVGLLTVSMTLMLWAAN